MPAQSMWMNPPTSMPFSHLQQPPEYCLLDDDNNNEMADNERPLHLQAFRLAQDIATGRHFLSQAIPILLVLADALLCAIVIFKIPYTEIDWKAYMEQVQQIVDGETEYTKIRGGTGPLVYPAAHVWIYTALYHITDRGKDIFLAQKLFAGLYLVTLAVVMRCYAKAGAPPYVLPLLILSKRLHSIFMLRCFNDCFAVFFLWVSILLFQRRSWTTGALVYSWGVAIKMTLILVSPAVGVLLFFAQGVFGTAAIIASMGALQVLVAGPFLKYPWAYLSRAFEFSRQFFFKWTVNWRFVGEDKFLSKEFSYTLLALQASVLVTFILTRWLPPTGKTIPDVLRAVFNGNGKRQKWGPLFKDASPQYILTTVLSANVIGLLFARSLHYQFYSYLAWSTPFLLWRSGMHPVLQYVLWALQEWAWNVFPSTPVSSAVVVGVMAITVAAVWVGTAKDTASATEAAKRGDSKE